MGEEDRSYGEYSDARVNARKEGWRDLAIWLATSFGVGLAPFLFVAIAFRAAYETHGHHAFPKWPMLFGSGELLLVTLSVTGATLAELWLNPAHIGSTKKFGAVAASLFIAAAAATLFTDVAYGHLTGNSAQIDRSFITELSAGLLIMVAVIQAVMLLTRPHGRAGPSR
jgi:hypothetical protein